MPKLRFISILTLGVVSLLAACANPSMDAGRAEAVLPLSRAWVNGQQVEYVSTDVSDAAMARATGVNHVPRLAAAISSANNSSLLERVYKFPKGEQISIFQSAPSPTGAANADRDYSPLWRVVLVTWLRPDKVRELKSEEALLSAEDTGEVSLEITKIVANCPVIRGVDGKSLDGVR